MSQSAAELKSHSEQLTTFFVDGEMFGIEVMKVQEVTGAPMIYPVPLAPRFVRGLVNLRGQIATSVGLREMFAHRGEPNRTSDSEMSVICKIDGNLISISVDSIGEVVEIHTSNFEPVPETVPAEVRKFVTGIYKLSGKLLSVLDLESVARELSPTNESTAGRNNQ